MSRRRKNHFILNTNKTSIGEDVIISKATIRAISVLATAMDNITDWETWLNAVLKEDEEEEKRVNESRKKNLDEIFYSYKETELVCKSENVQKKTLRRLASDVRKNLFIPGIKQRKQLKINEIYLYMGHFIKLLNPAVMLSCDFLSDEDRHSIKFAFRNYVSSSIQTFIMEMLYPFSVESAKGKSVRKTFKKEERETLIWQYVRENYDELYVYFNSDDFRQYVNMINLFITSIYAFQFKTPTDNIIHRIRSYYTKEYL